MESPRTPDKKQVGRPEDFREKQRHLSEYRAQLEAGRASNWGLGEEGRWLLLICGLCMLGLAVGLEFSVCYVTVY